MTFKLHGLYKWADSIIDKARGEFINDLENHFGSLDTISNKDRDELRSYAQKLNDDPWTYLFGVALSDLIEELPEYENEEDDEENDEEDDEENDEEDDEEDDATTVIRDIYNPLEFVEISPPPGDSTFLMMKYQVTQALYEEVMGINPSLYQGPQRPVEKVSWEDGIAFCNALSIHVGLQPAYRGTDNNWTLIEGTNGYRLPLESEWEWAARGGEDYEFAGSNKFHEEKYFLYPRRHSPFALVRGAQPTTKAC